MLADSVYRRLNTELEEDLDSTRRVVARLTDANHTLADKVTTAASFGGELYTKLTALERLGQVVQLRGCTNEGALMLLLEGLRELKDEAFTRFVNPQRTTGGSGLLDDDGREIEFDEEPITAPYLKQVG